MMCSFSGRLENRGLVSLSSASLVEVCLAGASISYSEDTDVDWDRKMSSVSDLWERKPKH